MRIILAVTSLSVMLASCSGTVDGDITSELTMADNMQHETSTDVSRSETTPLPDTAPADIEVMDDILFDIPADETGPTCLPGEGCFLDPCSSNDQCQSGWCVDHMGEGVCSAFCQEECPPGWSCKAVDSGGPDLVSVCVSSHANLCRPCASGADCKSVGGNEDFCLSYGTEGSFCGGSCTLDEDCPWGFSCTETTTVDGVSVKQCVADAGVCPCTAKSVELALWTPCELTTEFGVCAGMRICTEEGLTDCNALLPGMEICDGEDNDCDGEVDEPVLVDDSYVHVCDDGNACTEDICTGADGCQNTSLLNGECGDGDVCTVGDHCDAGVCVGTPVDCDDDNPCTEDSCDGLGGCAFANNTAGCDDSDPCTVADQCKEGICAGVAVSCDCQSDVDCAALEDPDLCNGTLVCNLDKLPYQCEVDPATVIECPTVPAGPDAICLTSACEPGTGTCSLVPDHEGLACFDADACTIGDICTDGTCTAGPSAFCADNNPCTDDSCDPGAGCQFTDNAAPCNDGDVCTTADICSQGQCLGGPELVCSDENACTDDSCNAVSGCLYIANEAACDDNNACTDGDQCADGLCGFSAFLDCIDDNPCTMDSCNPTSGCTNPPQAGPCEDGNSCTAGDYCENGSCLPGNITACNDNNPCTDDSCDEQGQCVHTSNQGDCSDGNECTIGDICSNGKCTNGGLLICADANICTTDTCDPIIGCVHTLNQVPCTDKDVCTTGDHCHLGECITNGNLNCDDLNPCTTDSCDPTAGCVHLPNSATCSDNNICTIDDSCLDGLCTGGKILECDDGNACTKDFCDLQLGCTAVNIQGLCDDGNACTVDSICDNGACTQGIIFTCDDDNPCTDDDCDTQTGCSFTNNEAACEDGDACTDGDLCAEGSCASGGATDCDDSNACTTDTCAPETGCLHPPVVDETDCGNGMHCVAGQCVTECETGGQTFNFTGNVQTFAVPNCVDEVVIEVWGAEGGPSESKVGGQGGYSKGTLTDTGGKTLYIYVGGKGGTAPNGTKGWNGGGIGTTTEAQRGGGGGGGTDVRLVGGAWSDSGSLNSRVIVAGGGGGGWNHPCCNPGVGGHGGGLTGGTAPAAGGAGPGTQNSSGCCGGAGFGVGGGNHTYGGGGGGWYGGGSADPCCAGAGAGGSGYVGGVSNGTTSLGGNTGNGKVTLSY
jgi:hypothetical protein